MVVGDPVWVIGQTRAFHQMLTNSDRHH